MDSLSVKCLRAMTESAISDAEIVQSAQIELERFQQEQKVKAEELRADKIIAQIPGLAKAEALKGKSKVVVMRLDLSDYDRPSKNNEYSKCQPEWLVGAAKLVYLHINEIFFDATLDARHDCMGQQDGFELVIHW